MDSKSKWAPVACALAILALSVSMAIGGIAGNPLAVHGIYTVPSTCAGLLLLAAIVTGRFKYERLVAGALFAIGLYQMTTAFANNPHEPSIGTAITMTFCGFNLCLPKQEFARTLVAGGLAMISLAAFAGYAFNLPLLYYSHGDIPGVGMAATTALGFCLASIGLAIEDLTVMFADPPKRP